MIFLLGAFLGYCVGVFYVQVGRCKYLCAMGKCFLEKDNYTANET